MAFIDLSDLRTKTDVSPRAEEGKKSIVMPEVDGERDVLLSGCSGCSKRSAHGVCRGIGYQPGASGRAAAIPIEHRIRAAEAHRVGGALFSAWLVSSGYIGDAALYNVGWGGDNASQGQVYEITAATSSTLTLYGRNPKHISTGRLRVNPEWPFADPETGLTSRLVPESVGHALPPGGVVAFHAPSVLQDKCVPRIVSIAPPESDDELVSFTVLCDQPVSAARRPLDLTFPPADGVYRCTVRFEALYPSSSWQNFQTFEERGFARVVRSITEAAEVELVDRAGASTRVLYPSWHEGAMTVTEVPVEGDAETWSAAAIEAVLSTIQVGPGSWVSTLDLSEVDFEGLASIEVVYYAEATAADYGSAGVRKVWYQAQCSNSQVDPSGSYDHAGGRFCANIACDGFGSFAAECWQPNASGFALGHDGVGFGEKPFPPKDLSAAWLGNLWHSANWILVQGLPGISSRRNFSFEKAWGPSVQSLCGGFQNSATGDYISKREPQDGPRFGKRVTWTDSNGDAHQQLVFGAWMLSPYDFANDEGPSYAWDAADDPDEGIVAELIPGWSSKVDALGAALTGGLEYFPYRGTGTTGLYSFSSSGQWMATAQELIGGAEAFLARVDTSDVDEDLESYARELYE